MNKKELRLEDLSAKQTCELCKKLLQELVVDHREKLHFWRKLTDQPAQIDTGYVAQHLVSLISKTKGDRMRGKGQDLIDGSEVKSANFLDSLDKRGAVAPRWNFSSNDLETMESYLKVPAVYLVSLDLNPKNKFRIRMWKLHPDKHKTFKRRYLEWMERKGKPKLRDPKRPGINFQLFPPRNKTNDTYARHGNNRKNGFIRIKIYLEGVEASQLIFKAEEDDKGDMQIVKLVSESPQSSNTC